MNLDKLAIRHIMLSAEEASERYVQLSIDRNFSSENCHRGTPENELGNLIREIREWAEALYEKSQKS